MKARKERAKALAADDPAAGKRVMLTAVDTMLWQTMASVLVPGLTINRVYVVLRRVRGVCLFCACCACWGWLTINRVCSMLVVGWGRDCG